VATRLEEMREESLALWSTYPLLVILATMAFVSHATDPQTSSD
jgi:hypothetical protein